MIQFSNLGFYFFVQLTLQSLIVIMDFFNFENSIGCRWQIRVKVSHLIYGNPIERSKQVNYFQKKIFFHLSIRLFGVKNKIAIMDIQIFCSHSLDNETLIPVFPPQQSNHTISFVNMLLNLIIQTSSILNFSKLFSLTRWLGNNTCSTQLIWFVLVFFIKPIK